MITGIVHQSKPCHLEAIAAKAPDLSKPENCHIYLGAAYVTQGRLDEAEQWLHAARLQAEQADLQDLVALILGRQGVIHAHRGKPVVAYQQAAQLWRLLDNQMEYSRNLANLGNIYLRLGEYVRARSYFEEALTAVQAIGARQATANLMLRLGNIYKRLGNYERAVACFEQSLALHRALQHKSGMASSLGWLGVMYNEMGRYAEAQAHYEQAIPLSQEAGDHLSLVVWMMNRAESVMYLGQRELAESLSQQAVDYCRSLGNTRFLPGAIIHQAEIQFVHGKYEQCRLALAEALPLTASIGDQKMNFDARLLQARLSDKFGERDAALAQLQTMITEFLADDYQAQLYYYLWQIEGDGTARQKAIPLYESLLAQAPNYVWRKQLNRLLAA
jgi:tetratricopeptide (TPR) repeat protein